MTRGIKTACAGIFLLAGSIILFEIALTRVFAIMMWHHFTYMVVSIALLGFGAAGSVLTVRREATRKTDPAGSLAFYACAYGVSVVLAFCFATLVRIDSLQILEKPKNIIALLLFYVIVAVPMFLGGMAIGLALTRMARHVNRLYFFDLLGSAAGGGLSVLALGGLGSTTSVMLAGALGCAAGFVFSLGGRTRHVVCSVPVLLLGVALVIGFTGGSDLLSVPALSWKVPYAPGKELKDYGDTETRIPSATAEVEVTPDRRRVPPMIGGNFGIVDAELIDARYVAQDGTAPTMLYKNAANLGAFPFLDDSQAGTAYVALAARGGKAPEVLVIGVGGGVDVMVALANGAANVTAVEINEAMIAMVTDVYADYIGRLFAPGAHEFSDRLKLVNREGRSYMRHSDQTYDIIQMSGVDSFTALSTGAYTLSESYLYTTEAIKEFYQHLNEDGYVNYSRFILNHPKKPRETLRLANIAYTALKELGVDDPASSILVFQGEDWASTMIRKGRFTAAEVEALKTFAAKQGRFRGLVFDPLRPKGAGFSPEARSLGTVRAYFEKALAAAAAVPPDADEAALAAAMTRAYARRFEGDEAASEREIDAAVASLPDSARGAAAGLLKGLVEGAVTHGRAEADQFLETCREFARLLRGSEEERAAFVAGYEYDVSPCTDDKPFFFNYYKWSSLFETPSEQGDTSIIQERYHPDFPVGHMVLLASLVQILILAVLFIFMPLRTLSREGVPTPGKWRYFAYFAALGLGFMFIEIVLMQKLVIFLGHPTYALSVVLTSLLGFAGLGSLLAGRIERISYRVLMLILLGILASIAIEVVATNRLLPVLLGWPFWARVGVVVVMLLPAGLTLGMAFPSGIRVLERNCPQLLPWGWAINGFMSVLASILCIVLSQELGFTRVLYIAAATYVAGFLLMKPEQPAEKDASASAAAPAADPPSAVEPIEVPATP